MKIIQILTTMSFGDAIGNNVLALGDAINEMGYETCIYAENIDNRLEKYEINKFSENINFNQEDIIIYHLSTGTDLNYKINKCKGNKILMFHNVTPSEYFTLYNQSMQNLCREGIKGVKYLSDKIKYGISVSEYNKQELIKYGYKCRLDVLPILIDFKAYDKKPKQKLINKYDDDWVNILFVGRIAPNKKQEDIIETFYYYNKYINCKSRLFFVGNYQGLESYQNRLQIYADKLGLDHVYFTGHIKFEEILAYYKISDVFLCMSEHEGFCVPIVEAMYFNVPVVAFDSTAISETLGGAGILFRKKEPLVLAHLINQVIINTELNNKIIEGQRKRLQYFSNERIKDKFKQYISEFIENYM